MSLTFYTFNDLTIHDPDGLERFFLDHLSRSTRYNSLSYEKELKVLTVRTKESAFSEETRAVVEHAIQQFPNTQPEEQWNVEDVQSLKDAQVIESASTYGYFPVSSSIDGDVVINRNTTLTRNMYYRNLTVAEGKTLNANGWRIVVTETLALYGKISHDGGHASGINAGQASSPPYTTFLGSGTSGAQGLTTTGNGNDGVAATYQCAGGQGGRAGNCGNLTGGLGGKLIPINAADGGIHMLSMMPQAFLGRLPSSNYYLQGGTGGGSSCCSKGTQLSVKTSGSGAGAGILVVAAKTIIGTGHFSARGGDASDPVVSGSGTHNGISGSASGGGGCIVLISHEKIPSEITFDVSGGTPGKGLFPGEDGHPGKSGNIFKLIV